MGSGDPSHGHIKHSLLSAGVLGVLWGVGVCHFFVLPAQFSPPSLFASPFSFEESGVIPEPPVGSGKEWNEIRLDLQQRVWELQALLQPSAKRTQGYLFTAKPMRALSRQITCSLVGAALPLPCMSGPTARHRCAEALSGL